MRLSVLAVIFVSLASLLSWGCGSSGPDTSAAPPTGPANVQKPAGAPQKSGGIPVPGLKEDGK